jgi:hypothetical protein
MIYIKIILSLLLQIASVCVSETNFAHAELGSSQRDTFHLDSFSYPDGANHVITFTIAGDGQRQVKDTNGTLPASFKYPFGVASDYFNAYLHVTDKFGQCLRRINSKSAQVETITFQNGIDVIKINIHSTIIMPIRFDILYFKYIKMTVHSVNFYRISLE